MSQRLLVRITRPDGTLEQKSLEIAECLLFGSGSGAQLRIEGAAALHCMVKREGGRLVLIDLGGGTLVEGKPIAAPTSLSPGERFEVARHQLECAVELELGPRADQPRDVEVAMLWGESVLEVRRFGPASRILVGHDMRCDFQLDDPAIGASFELASVGGGRCRVSIPAGATATGREGPLRGPIPLGADERLRVGLGPVCFEVRWVAAAARVGVLGPRDWGLARVVTVSSMVAAALLAAFFVTDVAAQPLSEDLSRSRRVLGWITPPPSPKKPKKLIKLPEQSQVKTPDPVATVDPDRKNPSRTKAGVDADKRDQDRKRVMSAGLLGAFGGAEGSTHNVFSSGLGTTINAGLGELKADQGTADAHGISGMGPRSVGPGGGPAGLGIGGVFTRPGGRGGREPGFSFSGDGALKKETTILPPRTVVVGSCERATIGRVISRHSNQVRYCYETELQKNQSLAGKIALSFTIDSTGAVSDASVAQSTLGSDAVEQCILSRVKRWKFPEPKNGVCVINYPYVFQPAGGTEEE
ncbi:MAG: TonB family protein [Myxococcales bacterium]